MTQSLEAIPSLQMRLAIHRRTVEYLEEQRAQFGAHAPVHIRHQLDEARTQIAQIKAELRALGVDVENHPLDIESDRANGHGGNGSHADVLRSYLRTVIDRLGYLSLNGLTDWRGPALKLADLYVPRELQPITIGAPQSSLPALIANGHARLLIESEPGGGKTTDLRRVAVACAEARLGDPQPLFPRPLNPSPVPLLLEAHDLIRPVESTGSQQIAQFGIWDLIEAMLRRDGLSSVLPALEHALRIGECLVLIDGLDDIVDSERGRALLSMLGRFVARYPDSSYVITCRRISELPTSALFGFTSYSLPPLDGDTIHKLFAAYYPAVAPITQLGVEDDETATLRLSSAVRGNEGLRTLASNPLGAVVSVLCHTQGNTLPNSRGTVYGYFLDLLLDRWEPLRLENPELTLARMLDVDALQQREARLALLQPLALAFQSRPDLSGDSPSTMRYAEVEPWLRESLMRMGVDSRRAVEHVIPRLILWCYRQGVLMVDASGSEYAMPWRCLREYLAARMLASRPDFPMRAYRLAAEVRWRETLLLTIRELNQGHGGHVARELLRLLLETPTDSLERTVGDPLLAAECLLEFTSLTTPERQMLAEIQERLQEVLLLAEAPTAERVRAGMLLGRLGDPRFAQQLPPVVRVPSGPFIFGNREGYDDEGPQQWVEVPAFAIGKYPVTNREYRRFLQETPTHAPPRYWHDATYNNPSQPVVGVTWNDSQAYCRWLTARLHANGLLPRSLEVRLPLEVEWEKAASWDSRRRAKRRFPWGDTWKTGAANTTEGRGAWVTTPVGVFPEGVSPYGAHDMIGNVWEWTASNYASYPGAMAPFQENEAYTLRGSSCASLPTHARCTYRSRLPPGYWRYHLGFRIVIGRPLTSLVSTP